MPRLDDLTNKRFGKLIVIKRVENNVNTCIKWLCKCDCGNESIVYGSSLRAGKTSSCGCLHDINSHNVGINNAKDLVGNRFGRFIVLERLGSQSKTATWKCKCDCGNEFNTSTSSITNGCKSCGCIRSEIMSEKGKKIGSKLTIDNAVFDTNVGKIRDRRPPKNNTSGFRGVSYRKDCNKYSAYIRFKKNIYWLGHYEDIKDATSARKMAEEQLYDSFLNWYDDKYIKK